MRKLATCYLLSRMDGAPTGNTNTFTSVPSVLRPDAAPEWLVISLLTVAAFAVLVAAFRARRRERGFWRGRIGRALPPLALGGLVLLGAECGVRMAGVVDAPLWLGYFRFPDNPNGLLHPCGDAFCADLGSPLDPCDAPPGPDPVLLVLGDSFAEGWGVRPEEAFVRALQLPGHVRRNCAAAGANLEKILATYERVAPVLRPRTILYALVLNDFEDLPRPQGGGDEEARALPLDATDLILLRSANFHSFLDRRREELGLWRHVLRSRLVALFYSRWLWHRVERRVVEGYRALFRDAPAALETALDRIAALRRDGARVVVAIFPLLQSLRDYPFEEAHRLLREGLTRRGVEVVDLLETFRGRRSLELILHPMDRHPNRVAHALAAQAIQRALSFPRPPRLSNPSP